jgi:hypothetical protein
LQATADRHGADILIAQCVTCPAQSSPDYACEIARLESASCQAFAERHQILGAKSLFEFGKCTQRKHQRAGFAADLRLDLPAMTVCHS